MSMNGTVGDTNIMIGLENVEILDNHVSGAPDKAKNESCHGSHIFSASY